MEEKRRGMVVSFPTGVNAWASEKALAAKLFEGMETKIPDHYFPNNGS
jgi:hypothetical protein